MFSNKSYNFFLKISGNISQLNNTPIGISGNINRFRATARKEIYALVSIAYLKIITNLTEVILFACLTVHIIY